MRKQSNKTRRTRKREHNANSPLCPAAISAIREIPGFLEGDADFSMEYLRSEYLSKFCSERLVPASLRRSAAIEKWYSTENRNADTNQRLRNCDYGYNILPRVTMKSFLSFARKLVNDILGPLNDDLVIGSFSGGASTSRRRTQSHPAQKFVGMADVTSDAVLYIDVIHRVLPLVKEYGAFYNLREVDGAILFTVPKKTDIDRCACKEPDINMFLQKGVGRHIRRQLLRFGINLNDQGINRKLAHVGSIDSSLATLDLSSASDTITIEAVKQLLPSDWFDYLNDIRSQQVIVDGVTHRTEMFSSMGNGFTFELESLLFYVLMRTTAYFENYRGIISVYGDDLIIPSGMFEMALWVLQHFGFVLNESKSFSHGFFRESCGGHYYHGADVTPFYLKRDPTRLVDIIRVANQLRRWAMAEDSRRYAMPSIYKLWTQLASYVPKDLWGGSDYSVDTQLVAPYPPNKRLVRASRDKELPPVGAYLNWHSSFWNRSIDPEEPGFEPIETEVFCRKRRVIRGASTCREFFYEELFPDAESGL